MISFPTISMLILAPIAAVVAMAAPAAAQTTECVTAAQLAQGVSIDFADGITENYRPLGPGVTSVTGMDGSTPIYRLAIAQGTHLIDYIELQNGQPDESTHQTYDYGQPPETLPIPVHGERFNIVVTVTAADGVRPEAQSQAYVTGEPLVLGACTYQTIEAVIAYDTANNYMESITYIPEIGIGFLHWSQTDEGPGAENTVIGLRSGK